MSVPDYPHYELGGFSEWFKGQDPGEEGAVLSVEPTDHTYTDLDGSTKNFESCTIELPDPKGDGVLYVKMNVDENEKVAVNTAQELLRVATTTRLLQQLGCSAISFFDAHPATSQLNTWTGLPNPSIEDCLLGTFRSDQVVDHTYPVEYREAAQNHPLPATRASMDIIAHRLPDVVFSGHNASIGGQAAYVSGTSFALARSLKNSLLIVAPDLPLSGTGDLPMARELTKGVYQLPTFEEWYDYNAEQYGESKASAMSPPGRQSIGYAQKIGEEANKRVRGVMLEAAHFAVPQISAVDHMPGESRKTLSDMLRESLYNIRRTLDYWDKLDLSSLDPSHQLIADQALPLAKTWESILPLKSREAMSKREVSRAVLINTALTSFFYGSVAIGMTHRLAVHTKNRAVADELHAIIHDNATKIEQIAAPKLVKPQQLIRGQLASILLTLYDSMHVQE